MELRHLRYFLAVAETGHMTRAAEHLGIQQPPLSQQIKSLEQQLGIVLFLRHAKGVTLTDGGRLFQDEARRILRDTEAMQARMARVARGELGRLDIGITSSAGIHAFTPTVLRAWRKSYPDVSLALTESNAAEITDGVAAGRMHCGLIRVPVAEPEELAFDVLLREPVLVAVPVDHELVRTAARRPNKALSIDDLRGQGLILVRNPGAPGLYHNLLSLLAEAGGEPPAIVAEVARMTTNINLVAAGMGVSVVPASMCHVHADAVAYLPFAQSDRLDAPLTLVYRKADNAGPVANFVALCRRTARAGGNDRHHDVHPA